MFLSVLFPVSSALGFFMLLRLLLKAFLQEKADSNSPHLSLSAAA